jgi:putative hemin transport protein
MATRFDTPLELSRAWDQLRSERVRARDAATQLGVSEATLVASKCGSAVTRLTGDPRAILGRIPALGPVMALTRNADCVHEKDGQYLQLSLDGSTGLVLGPDIDLRLFFAHWCHGFAVAENEHRSLQFFDAAGDAVHKIYLRSASDRRAYADLVFDHAAPQQAPYTPQIEPAASPSESPDETVDAPGLRRAWAALQDTHDFFPMLRKFGVTRTQALRLASPEHASTVPNDSVVALLHAAERESVSIMVFVGNRGCIQIHTGPIARVAPTGTWINVLDPGFNLHLQTRSIAQSWIVRKPTADGVVTSLELYDAAGGTIAQFFGERKPGIPERSDWRALLSRIAPTVAA